jgi:ribose 5-phosphate isomerase B
VTIKDDALQQIVRQVVTRVLAEQNASSSSTPAASAQKTVAIGADHGGVAMKTDLVKYLNELGYAVNDCGAFSTDPVDYPDIAYAVAKLVSDGAAVRGIVIDGAGIGSAMTANKVPGVRAALCYDLSTARNAREHNDANVLTLGARLIGAGLARDIVQVFLETECTEARHQKRVAKIMDVEKRYLKK